MEGFQNQNILVFDLTLLHDKAEQLPYPELSEEKSRLEVFFLFPLEQVTEVIFLEESLSKVEIDKNVEVFELIGSYKIFFFWDFPSVLSLYYLFCFIQRLNSRKNCEWMLFE